jgi:hypothetical protein
MPRSIVHWTNDERRIVTGSDILGRLLRGIAKAGLDQPGCRD